MARGGDLARLRESCTSAITAAQSRVKIAGHTVRLTAGENVTAWGQDFGEAEPKEHVGIYGTAAAAQILALTPPVGAQPNPLVEGAVKWLWSELKEPASKSNSKHDTLSTFKAAALVSGLSLGRADAGDFGSIPQIILRLRSDVGWGKYREPGKAHGELGPGDSPSVLSTAVALLSIADHRAAREQAAYSESLTWLVKAVKARVLHYQETRDPSSRLAVLTEVALSLLCLSTYKDRCGSNCHQDFVTAREEVADLLQALVDRQRPGYREVYGLTYRVPTTEFRNRYVAFVVCPIVALALIESDRASANLRFIRRAAEFYSAALIKDKGVFRPSVEKTPAVSELSWVVRFLWAFVNLPIEKIGIGDRIRGDLRRGRRSHTVLAAVFVLLCLLTASATYNSTKSALSARGEEAFVPDDSVAPDNETGIRTTGTQLAPNPAPADAPGPDQGIMSVVSAAGWAVIGIWGGAVVARRRREP